MSILGNNSGSMSGPFFHEFKKQASFFLKEKIKTARLALTDVTPAQLLVEEATNGNPDVPDARTLKIISRAAFEVDDYWRIVDILHKRLLRFDGKSWRDSYNALIVLENLLTHGPERVAEEFQCDRDVIAQMESFQHIDEKGFNWGLIVRKKSERILKLLQKGPLLKEERETARKISRGIQGFGSFSSMTSLDQAQHHESSVKVKPFGRCKSEFSEHTSPEDFFAVQNKDSITAAAKTEKSLLYIDSETEHLRHQNYNFEGDSKENFDPREEVIIDKELKPLLGEKKPEFRLYTSTRAYHSFNDGEHDDLANMSLLSAADELQAF